MSQNVTEGEAIHSARAAEVSRGRSPEERRKTRTVPSVCQFELFVPCFLAEVTVASEMSSTAGFCARS